MNFGDIYALVLKEYPEELKKGGAYELWRYICVSLKRIPRYFNR